MTDKQATPNPKCTRCKCYWKPDETDIKSSGLCCITCKKCRNYKKPFGQKYYEENTEKCNNNRKENYQKNKEELCKKVKCECGSIYAFQYKSRHFLTKKHKNLLDKNTEVLNQKEKCECGGFYLFQNKSIHISTKQHKNYFEKIAEEQEKNLETVEPLV